LDFILLAKFLPVAFGVKKLQIGCVVEDDKVNHL
jgi:translation elongation factor EF-1beta